MIEQWKDIPGYEGLYQASNHGDIRSLPRTTTKGGVLKPKLGKEGYFKVQLCRNGKVKDFHIHRLVAKAFLPNPNSLPQVNHRDLNKINNCVSNLEWCTSQYNVDYSNSKRVLQFDKNGNFIQAWKSTKEIERKLKIRNGNISNCCHGRYKTAGGYVWRYDV